MGLYKDYKHLEIILFSAHEKLQTISGNVEIDTILWTSELTNAEHIEQYLNNSQYIIQIWTASESR